MKFKKSNDVIAVSEGELIKMTSDLDAMHHDVGMPALRSSLLEWIDGPRANTSFNQTGLVSRRSMLIGTGAVALGGVFLAACSNNTKPTSNSATTATTKTSGTTGTPAKLTGTLKVAALAASLENLGVYAYTAGIKAAVAGKLGKVPPAVVTFAKTAMTQHKQHGAAWNSVLTGAGKKAVTITDPKLTPTVNTLFSKVKDVAGLAMLALTIENIAAQTYQAGALALVTTKAIQTAASIQPVEMQHAAILNFVLGKYPVPNAFNPVATARSTSDLG